MNPLQDDHSPNGSGPFLVGPAGPIRQNATTTPVEPGALPAVEPETGGLKGCPNSAGFLLHSPTLETRIPRPCRSWSCPSCGNLKRLAARELFTVGMDRAFEEYGAVRAITLTAPGRGRMTLEDLAYGFRRVTTAYLRKREDGTRQVYGYAAVVEFQKRGAPHIHALFAGPEFLPMEELRGRAVGRSTSRGRFGPRIGLEAVRRDDAETVGSYLTKFEDTAANLAGYLTKGKAEGWHRDGRTRIRPVWSSRGWYPGGLTAAETAVRTHLNGGEPAPKVSDWRLERVNPETGALEDLGPVRPTATVHAFRTHLRAA